MTDIFIVIYLDDILIFSDSLEEHQVHVRRVLERLREYDLHSKPEKCLFHMQKIEFLGFMVTPTGISMDTAKTDAVSIWPTPTNLKAVQGFLGFANFYRRFIVGFSDIVIPLICLTRKDTPFAWVPDHTAAFEILKHAFTQAPILAHFNPDNPIIVETDASDYTIAAIISQISPDDGDLHPIVFYSRSMQPAELNYEIYDKELLAILEAFQQWRNYLIRYCAGRLGTKPDVLTRQEDVYPRGEDAYALANPHNFQSMFKAGQLLRAIILDSASLLVSIHHGLQTDLISQSHLTRLRVSPDSNTPAPSTPSPGDPWSLSKDGDFLRYNELLYVPDNHDVPLDILRSHHDHHLAGHPGITKTIKNIRRQFYWPRMVAFVTDYIHLCSVCSRSKSIHHKPFGPHRFLPIGQHPWDSISMDFIERLPLSDGHDTILVVVCHLTKMALFIPTFCDIDAQDLAHIFLSHVCTKHGTPTDIVSDRGKHFISRFWRSLCQLLDIKANLSTAYHPETDGQMECVNQILEQYLRVYINYQQDDWVNLLPLAEFAYNNTSQSATMVTPFFANKGFHPKFEVSLDSVVSETAHQVATDLKELHQYLRDQVARAIKQYEVNTASHRLPIPPFQIGDTVWLDASHIKTTRPSKKLDHRFLGPFPNVDRVLSHAFRLGLPLTLSRIHPVFHVSLLQPTNASSIPNRLTDPPLPIELDNSSEWEVDRILDSKVDR